VVTLADVRALDAEVRALREVLLAAETARAGDIAAVHPSHRRSAANLVHYLELRHHDIRELQASLAALGVSSLGRSEPFVLATVEAVLTLLDGLIGQTPPPAAAGVSLTEGHTLLADNADRLLGPAPARRSTRIMVTLPSEAADDASLVAGLLAHGMDLVRVNCAHDGAEKWGQMIRHLCAGVAAGGRPCRIAMDLGGPKLRTGPLLPGPRAMRISPRRGPTGLVVEPARLWFTAPGAPTPHSGPDEPIPRVPVDDGNWIDRRLPGDRVRLWDSRGAHRHFDVLEVVDRGCLVSTEQTSYLATGLKLSCRAADDDDAVGIGELPEIEQAHRVHRGDQIILTRSLAPQMPTRGREAHAIGCSLAAAFQYAQAGEPVLIDDGKIRGIIDDVDADEITLTVTDVRPGGVNLKSDKGINLPATDLHLDALTTKDLGDLAFVAAHADVVNVSFVRRPEDVEAIQRELHQRAAGDVGIVLKIENVAAFGNLPELLLTALRSPKVGVMIARGDLAVEVGFERMQGHQAKKRSLLRRLHAWDHPTPT
jgi:pyruvate kinase